MNFNNSFQNYKIVKKIGKGSFGVVYKISIKDKFYALKQIDLSSLSSHQIEYITNEVTILSSLNNEFIVKYYSSFTANNENNENNEKDDNSHSCMNIIMEYCDAGDLSHLLHNYKSKNLLIDQNLIKNIFLQVVKALHYIHSKKILHRDLKTMNVLLFKDGRVKLGDFGVAKVLKNSSFANTFIGTPYYLSPELCEEKPYNEKSDIWSLGCILYELVTLKKPFDSKTQMGLLMKIVKGKYESISSLAKNKYENDILKLIDVLLSKDANKRPYAREILSLDFFKGVNEKIEKNEKNENSENVKNSEKSDILPSENKSVPLAHKRIHSANIFNQRVRINPKDKSGNQLSRQAQLANQIVTKNKNSTPCKNNHNVNKEVKNSYDEIMKKIDQFDSKFGGNIAKHDKSTDNTDKELLNDNLTATAFFKEIMKTDNYDQIFKQNHCINLSDRCSDKIPLIYEINDNLEIEEDQQEGLTAKPSEEQINNYKAVDNLIEKAKSLIDENKFHKIFTFYSNLVNEECELTDEHSNMLDDYIKDQLKDLDKAKYIEFLELFYRIVYLKYIESINLK